MQFVVNFLQEHIPINKTSPTFLAKHVKNVIMIVCETPYTNIMWRICENWESFMS